jgi:membrane protease YdiL (CAAX protease family)
MPGTLAWCAAPARRAVALTLAALVAFYASSGLYAALVRPAGEQDIVETLGAERGLGYLLGATVLVVLIAPFAEEIFFRGFFYRALRNRLSTARAAAIAAVVFGRHPLLGTGDTAAAAHARAAGAAVLPAARASSPARRRAAGRSVTSGSLRRAI